MDWAVATEILEKETASTASATPICSKLRLDSIFKVDPISSSGQAAVITRRQVTSGLGARRVKAVAAANHHTVVATEGGEVFPWGSNREGQLGYTSVDSQPTPRRVSSLKEKIVVVAAANKHTAVVSEAGEVYT